MAGVTKSVIKAETLKMQYASVALVLLFVATNFVQAQQQPPRQEGDRIEEHIEIKTVEPEPSTPVMATIYQVKSTKDVPAQAMPSESE